MISIVRVDRKLAITVYFVIAVLIRYYFSIYKPNFLSAISEGMLYAVLTGIGPWIGGIVAIYLLRRNK